MPSFGPPPLPGEWVGCPVHGSGNWTVGDIWVDRTAGRMALFVTEQHCNAYGVMHGGALATLVDSQSIAVRDYSGGAADHTPTVSLSVDYIGPIPRDHWLLVDVTLLQVTRNLIFTQAVMTVDGAAVGRSNAIYRNFKGKDAT